MKIWNVTKEVTTSQKFVVEAETKDKAIELAKEMTNFKSESGSVNIRASEAPWLKDEL